MATHKAPYIVGYLRTSQSGGEEGVSLEGQRAALEEFIKRNLRDDYPNSEVHFFTDDGISASKLLERPDFTKAVDKAVSRRGSCLVVWDLTRFSREVVGALTAVDRLEAAGCKLFDTSNGKQDWVGQRMLFTIMASVAEQQARSIAKNIERSIVTRNLQGRFTGGTAPYGMKSEPRKDGAGSRLVKDKDTAPVVKRIFELRAAGKSSGKIAETLNSERVVPPSGKPDGSWSRQVVARILGNRTYLGEHRFFKEDPDGTVVERNSGKVGAFVSLLDKEGVPVKAHQQIITDSLWRKVEAVKNNAVLQQRRVVGTNGGSLLRGGILRCGLCGGPMTGGGESYQCRNRYALRDTVKCPTGVLMHTKAADEYILDVVARMAFAAAGAGSKKKKPSKDGTDLQAKYAELDRREEKAREDRDAKRISRSEHSTILEAIDAAERELKREERQAQEDESSSDDTGRLIASLEQAGDISEAVALLSTWKKTDQLAVVMSYISEIVCHPRPAGAPRTGRGRRGVPAEQRLTITPL